MNAFVRRLFREHSPQIHAVNTFSVGLWLWLQKPRRFAARILDNMAIALLTHARCGHEQDAGFSA